MHNPKSIPLTASELGYLWTGYSINEMSKWYLTVFREQSKDADIKDLYTYSLQNNNNILLGRKKILEEENYPIPVGFSEKDIDVNAPSLFSDRFLLLYLFGGARLGLEFHTRSLALATRDDVRQYNIECLNSTIQLNEKVVNLLLSKGLYWRTPTLPTPTQSEVIQKSSYLNGWFGDTRPINSMEIANLYFNLDLLIIMDTLFTGFAKSSNSDKAVELFKKGVTLTKNQYRVLAAYLEKDNLPIPPLNSAEVKDANKRIFSDRIMVTHMAGLLGSLLSQYGFSLGCIMSHDLVTTYISQISKAGAFSEKTTRYLIENEWLEKVPGALERPF